MKTPFPYVVISKTTCQADFTEHSSHTCVESVQRLGSAQRITKRCFLGVNQLLLVLNDEKSISKLYKLVNS